MPLSNRHLRIAPDGRDHREHEALFLAQYGRLWILARRLAGADRSHAEDLLQDCYLQFVERAPDLTRIEDPGAYLATTIRNLHVSRMRRHANQSRLHVSLEDFDSAALALQAVPADQQLAARVALVRICSHLNRRKDSSRPAAAMILRFLHDYESADIARLARTTVAAVHDWLRQARKESRLAVEQVQSDMPPTPGGDVDQLLRDLRSALFETCRTPCPSEPEWTRVYAPAAGALDTSTLAHLVSCPRCLVRATLRVGLSATPFDESDDPPPPTRGRDSAPEPREIVRKASRRARDIRRHRPRQLFVSVNGFAAGELSVGGATTHGRWLVRHDEPISFVELHSEQGVRMAMLQVMPMALGHVEQSLDVPLADDRLLTLSIDFSTAQPSVSVRYSDPGDAYLAADFGTDATIVAADAAPEPTAWHTRLRALLYGPRVATAWALMVLVLVLGLGATWFLSTPAPAPLAATLLGDARAAEQRANVEGAVTIETAKMTVTPLAARASSAAYRIERWTDRGAPRDAWRVLDPSGRVVAGRWANGDARDGSPLLDALALVWQSGLSAETIRDRLVVGRTCLTTANASTYSIDCVAAAVGQWLNRVYPSLHAQESGRASALTVRQVSIAVDRSSRLVTRLAVMARIDQTDYEVVVSDRASARPPAGGVPADVFAPAAPPAASRTPNPTAVASPSLEIRLVELVDRVAGQDEVLVQRQNGTLTVVGHVARVEQKQALLAAIRAVDAPGLVSAEVQTFAEAAARGRAAVDRVAPPTAEARVLPSGPPPFEAYLRRARPELEAAVVTMGLSSPVMAAARAARREARALRALVHRYPASALTALDAGGRAAWSAMVTRRASAAQSALLELRTALAPYLDADGVAEHASATGADTRGIGEAIHRLDDDTAVIDDAIGHAFAASSGDGAAGDVTPDLSHHVRHAERTAALVRSLAELPR